MATLFETDDPMMVLRTSPEGDERARAMRRLKEPVVAGRPDEQDEALQYLSTAATSDPSPVVRVAAIDALSRFQDQRATQVLIAAFHQAGGDSGKPPVPTAESELTKVSARQMDRINLTGPTGFAPEVAMVVRSRAVQAMASTGRAEVVPLLTQAATGDGNVDRDTRLAAVRALSQYRNRESVVALAKVLKQEKGKDPALANRAHAGLRNLTGQSHAADPETWEAVVRGNNFQLQPEGSAIQQAASWILDQ